MLVEVDCTLRPSRLRWVIVFGISIVASALLLSLPVSPGYAGLSLVFVLFAQVIWRREITCEHLSFRGADVLISAEADALLFRWRGEAVRSSAFIRLRLFNEAQEPCDLTIWRDSVPNDRWRALNMAVRVHETQAKNQPV